MPILLIAYPINMLVADSIIEWIANFVCVSMFGFVLHILYLFGKFDFIVLQLFDVLLFLRLSFRLFGLGVT